jgi:hypothetical protein
MLQRVRLCAALLAVVVAVVVGVAVLPAATGSATVARSSICQAYKSAEAQQAKANTALSKDATSGNWTLIQKDLLASLKKEAGAEKAFAAYLNGASAKVKSAAAVVLKLDGSFKTMAQHSTSLTQFETGITTAESTPKVTAALKVLGAYSTKRCGTITATP